MNPKLSDILLHSKQFSNNIILQMPKNTNIDNLIKVINMCYITPLIRIDRIYIHDKISQLLVWLGDLNFTQINREVIAHIIIKDVFETEIETAINLN